MANDVSGTTWYVDTPGVVWTQRVYIRHILWNAPAAGNALVIKDILGRFLVNTVANTNDPMFEFKTHTWQYGFVLTTLGGGTLQVHVNK